MHLKCSFSAKYLDSAVSLGQSEPLSCLREGVAAFRCLCYFTSVHHLLREPKLVLLLSVGWLKPSFCMLKLSRQLSRRHAGRMRSRRSEAGGSRHQCLAASPAQAGGCRASLGARSPGKLLCWVCVHTGQSIGMGGGETGHPGQLLLSLGERRVAGGAQGSVPISSAWREGTAAGHLRELRCLKCQNRKKENMQMGSEDEMCQTP